jgi:curved DNA-binding protein CbpA
MPVLEALAPAEHQKPYFTPGLAEPDLPALQPESKGLSKPPKLRLDERIAKALFRWISDGSDSGSGFERPAPPLQPPSEPTAPEAPEAPESGLPAYTGIAEGTTTDADPARSLPVEETPEISPKATITNVDDRSLLRVFPALPAAANYYELLQISPNADLDTIQRVYRFMAGRFHPDNPETGDKERFLLIKKALEVLSDPVQRAEYDKLNGVFEAEPLPVFGDKAFVDGPDGEKNRRFGVLSLLYYRRRISGAKPGLSLLELEKRMAFPREYLEFTIWYLQGKGYIGLTDSSSDYALTTLGVDYVETYSSSNKVVRELLGPGTSAGLPARLGERAPGGYRIAPSLKENARRRSRAQRAYGIRLLERRTADGGANSTGNSPGERRNLNENVA